MNYFNYAVIALIIIVIIVIVYYMINDSSPSTHARELADKSAGGYDEYAQGALAQIDAMTPTARTAEDAFRAGTILEYNVLGGIEGAGVRGGGAREDVAVGEGIGEDVAVANIVNNIARRYVETMDRITENTMRGNDMGADAATMAFPVMVMVDHIEHFADNVGGGFGGGGFGGGIGVTYIIEDNAMEGGIFDALFARVAENAPMVREHTRETRRVRAAEAAENRAAAITNYLDATTTHVSDPQNVHDSHVNEDLRATLTRIEASQKTQPLPVVIANMGEFVLSNNCDITPEKRRLVFKSLEIIGRNQHIGTLQSTEGNVFKCVWDRAEDPSNVINETLIKNALAQSLVDFWENGADHDPVCINGRCSRMLASLVLLDYDDKVGIVQTKEMIKNEIIDLSTKIINSSIEQACASDNEGRRRVGESYMGTPHASSPPSTPDPAEERKFIDELKQKIQTMLDLNYRDKLDKRDFENIRDDIFAGLE